MSLQTRISALITTIKGVTNALGTRVSTLEGKAAVDNPGMLAQDTEPTGTPNGHVWVDTS